MPVGRDVPVPVKRLGIEGVQIAGGLGDPRIPQVGWALLDPKGKLPVGDHVHRAILDRDIRLIPDSPIAVQLERDDHLIVFKASIPLPRFFLGTPLAE